MPESNGRTTTDEDDVRAIEDILDMLEQQHRVVRDKTEAAQKAASAAAATLKTVEEVRQNADEALRQANAAVESAAKTQRKAEAVRQSVEAAEKRAGQSLAAFDDATSQRIADAKAAVEQGRDTLGQLVEARSNLEQVFGPDTASAVQHIKSLRGQSEAALELARRVDAHSGELAVRLATDESRIHNRTLAGIALSMLLLVLSVLALARSGGDPPPPARSALVGVLNGSSIPALAEQTADYLELKGLPVAVIGNASANDALSKIYYRDGFRDQALELASSLDIDLQTQLERVDAEWVRDIAPSALPLHLDVVVVVGRDIPSASSEAP